MSLKAYRDIEAASSFILNLLWDSHSWLSSCVSNQVMPFQKQDSQEWLSHRIFQQCTGCRTLCEFQRVRV